MERSTMPANTTGRRKTRRKPSAENEARKAEVELTVKAIDDEAPDYLVFLNRWSGRYAEANLQRLWVQAPGATCLHKFGTWRGMGRQVRTGEHAIWLRIPHTSRDADKITPDNPDGEIFHGAPWMGLFDYAQTDPIGDFTEDAPGANPDLLAEVKRLRREAVKLHPDTTMADTAAAFMAAWAAYETAKARLDRETRS
jgi:hypothetical protein